MTNPLAPLRSALETVAVRSVPVPNRTKLPIVTSEEPSPLMSNPPTAFVTALPLVTNAKPVKRVSVDKSNTDPKWLSPP